jgi:RNA 3'-terminal phosphate cyclase (ATP)
MTDMNARTMIQLDGADGGGQMLRSALTLAMITGKPFRMTRIRGKRRKPGLMRQHLTCVHAACEISGGTTDGAETGSTELVFRAGAVKPGSYRFAIGTAGSTGLLLQTLLPALWLADGPSTLHLSGGTHNPLAPPFDFLERTYLPALRRLGAHAELRLLETGFAPAGGGAIECAITPCKTFQSIDFTDRGELLSTQLRVPFRNVSPSIALRLLDSARSALPCDDARIHQLPNGPSQGIACLFECSFTHSREIACTFGERGVSGEQVGRRAARLMEDFLQSGASVGRYLADQLLLPLALAGGGRLTTVKPDDHVATNIRIIEAFLPVKFDVAQRTEMLWEIRCSEASADGD